MTTRSYTDGDDVPTQPAVRSAWDAAKYDVLQIAANAGFAAFFTAFTIYHAAHGNTRMAIGLGLLDLGQVMLGLSATGRLYRKLSRLPAPKP